MCKLVFSLILLSLFSSQAQASQIVDLGGSEIGSTNFFAKCVSVLDEHPYEIQKGTRGTFQQGIVYQYWLRSSSGKELILGVRWTAATDKFECTKYFQ